MSPRTLSFTLVMLALRAHLTFTLRRLRKHLLTKDLGITALFEQMLAKWSLIQQQELDLESQIDDCAIEIVAQGHLLDIFAKRLSSAILLITENNRSKALYVHYFGDRPLHEFLRLSFEERLEAMGKWMNSLAESQYPSLVALGAELPALIESATQADAAKSDARQQRKDFREVGTRKRFVDEVNGARKEAYGVLDTLRHKHPELPSKFASQFFQRARTKRGEEVTIESLEADIVALQEELTEKEALRSGMKDAEEKAVLQAAEKKTAREAFKSELEMIEKDLVAKQKRAEELKSLLDP